MASEDHSLVVSVPSCSRLPCTSTHFRFVFRPSLENRSRQISNVSDAVLSSVQRDLSSLRSFVEQSVARSLFLSDVSWNLTFKKKKTGNINYSPRSPPTLDPHSLTSPTPPNKLPSPLCVCSLSNRSRPSLLSFFSSITKYPTSSPLVRLSCRTHCSV